MEEQFDLDLYLSILRRRFWAFVIPSVLVLGLTLVITTVLPSIYVSEGTMLVEAQELPESMVQTTVTGFLEDRLMRIKQLVLSRDNLLELIETFDLYPELKQEATTRQLVDQMRQDISLNPLTAEIAGSSGREQAVTISYTLSYQGKDRRKVALVANNLVSRFIEEYSRYRENRAGTTVEFFQSRMQELERELHETEQNIAEFKEANLMSMPELLGTNLQNQERTERRLSELRSEIRGLQERRAYLQGQLALLDSTSEGFTSQTMVQLEEMRARYLTLKAAFSPEHPDVISLKEKIKALERSVENRQEGTSSLARELKAKELELDTLSKTYSDLHPDVIQAKKSVQKLRERLLKAQEAGAAETQPEQMQNPAAVNLRTRIRTTEMDLARARQELQRLRQQYAEYETRLEKASRVEQEYVKLQRDHRSLQTEYQNIKAKLLEAREAKEMEKNRLSQKLRLIEPPVVPEEPAKPNRLALVLVGSVLAVGFGVGSGALLEFMDTAVYGPEDLQKVGPPVLGMVPLLENKQDKLRRRILKLSGICGSLLAFGLLIYALHVVYLPLDVLWDKVFKKIQLMI